MIRVIAIVGVAAAVWLAITRPLGTAEAALWDHLVRPPLEEAFRAPDAWSGILYSVLAERSIGLFRLSVFSLRLPSVLAAAACGAILWRSRNRMLAVAYVTGIIAGWFSTAQGGGVALAFWAASLYWTAQAGWLFGLALAANPLVAPLALMYWRLKDIERVVIPAVITAFILLILPVSHAGAADPADARPKFERETNRRNTARGGGFQPPETAGK